MTVFRLSWRLPALLRTRLLAARPWLRLSEVRRSLIVPGRAGLLTFCAVERCHDEDGVHCWLVTRTVHTIIFMLMLIFFQGPGLRVSWPPSLFSTTCPGALLRSPLSTPNLDWGVSGHPRGTTMVASSILSWSPTRANTPSNSVISLGPKMPLSCRKRGRLASI